MRDSIGMVRLPKPSINFKKWLNKTGIAEEAIMKAVLFVIILTILIYLIVYVFGAKLQTTTRGIPWA